MSERPISPLRQRMLEDMTVRKLGDATQRSYSRTSHHYLLRTRSGGLLPPRNPHHCRLVGAACAHLSSKMSLRKSARQASFAKFDRWLKATNDFAPRPRVQRQGQATTVGD